MVGGREGTSLSGFDKYLLKRSWWENTHEAQRGGRHTLTDWQMDWKHRENFEFCLQVYKGDPVSWSFDKLGIKQKQKQDKGKKENVLGTNRNLMLHILACGFSL